MIPDTIASRGKKLLWRATLAVGTIGAVIAGSAAFSAFEAHVINVTATIENATTMDTTPLTFGEMFPQEIRVLPETISLSNSFLSGANTNATQVDYVIKQKPKCGLPETDVASGTPVSYSAYEQVADDAQGNFICPDAAKGYVILPLLCPYLSKTSPTRGDISVPSFHGPTSTPAWTDAVASSTAAVGHLTKGGVTTTTWQIDLHTPCFRGECAQDWASFVHTANPAVVDPTAYEADPALEHQQFGCDLWYEVTGINATSTTPTPTPTVTTTPTPTVTPTPPTIGADQTFVAPSGVACNVIVDPGATVDATHSKTINGGIADAVAGNTVCVAAGTYPEDVVINKSITLAGAGESSSIVNGQATGQGAAVTIATSSVTVEGLQINGAGIAALWLNTGVTGANVHDNHLTSASGQTALTTQGQQSNDTFTNNIFSGNGAGQLAYVNGFASLGAGQESDNVDFVHNTFDGTIAAGGEALGTESTNSNITQNIFKSTLTSTYAIAEAWKADAVYSQNNFDGVGGIKVRNSDPSLATVNAQNNWWGAAAPSGNTFGNVDDSLKAGSAFPEN